jgi:hypothetical protein
MAAFMRWVHPAGHVQSSADAQSPQQVRGCRLQQNNNCVQLYPLDAVDQTAAHHAARTHAHIAGNQPLPLLLFLNHLQLSPCTFASAPTQIHM